MEIIEVTATEYDSLLTYPNHVFNSAKFAELNKEKCERIFYLIFKDSKIRLGIIFGLRDNGLYSPFSAPFGGFQYSNSDVTIKQIDDCLMELDYWVAKNNFSKIQIVQPPVFLDENFISKVQNSFFRYQYITNNLDVNYHFAIKNMNDNYIEDLKRNAKKNLKRGLESGLNFIKLNNEDGEIAYNVIAKNRLERGFPLRMTWEQVKATTALIPCDFFLVTKNNEDIASAVVFHVTKKIVQVVYWGDLPEYSENKTMNFLSFNVFNYYKIMDNVQYVDIGISTVDSIPNHGLCEFKESIGCDLSLKSVFVKNFN